MPSISEVRRKIPDEFSNSLFKIFSPGTVDKILFGMSRNRLTTLRVNNIKYDIHSLMEDFKSLNIKFERVSWYTDALIIKNLKEKDIMELSIFREGKIYMQGLSSMIPPLVLRPEPGDKILDMTAAPGSKTTQIASIMKNNGYILANELDKIRAERLKYNVVVQDANIVEINVGDAILLGNKYYEHFDKVMLDAPCSGEGRFNIEDSKSYRGWSIKEVSRLSKLQKKLFESAYNALKKNGIMVYSTCTINVQENEEILSWGCKKFNLKILDTGLKIPGAFHAFNIGDQIFTERALRILPSKHMEGFFICRLKKL